MFFNNIKNLISEKPKLGLVFPQLNIALSFQLFLLIHITLSCNRKCRWCYQTNDKFYPPFSNMDMEIKMFEKILSSFKYFKPHIHIYGGEPLFHPDFPLFLKYSQIYGYKPTLTTNGDYLDKYSGDIIKSTLSQVNISLNGLIDYNGNIDVNLGEKIKKFVMMNKGSMVINVNYVIEPSSYNYIEDIILYLNDNYKKGDFACFVIQHLNKMLRIDMKETTFNLKKLVDVLTRVKKLNLKFKLLFLPNIKICDIENYYATKYTFKNKCYVPWLGLSIYPDLTVTPGGGVLGCNFTLGNLGQASIKEIWRGSKLKDFRSKLIQEGLPEICNRCCHKFYY